MPAKKTKRKALRKPPVSYPRVAAIMLQEITFAASGRVAVVKDQRVWIEWSETKFYTTWIYDRADVDTGKLLYTLNHEQRAWEFVALLKADKPRRRK